MTANHAHEHEHGHGYDKKSPEDIPRSPQFQPGADAVLANAVPERYKRHPDYAEGTRGIIDELHGAYLPPTESDDSETDYEFLYSVRFSHAELFDNDNPEWNGYVYIDAWEAALKQ